MSFEWKSDDNAVYTADEGSRVIYGDGFDKLLGFSFTMDALDCELNLKINADSDCAFMWPVATEFSESKKTNINVQNGTLVISPERLTPVGIIGKTGEKGNRVYITVNDGAVLKIKDIHMVTHEKEAGRCDWKVSGDLIMNGGSYDSTSAFKLLEGGCWTLNQEYVNLSGDFVIDSSSVNDFGYCCLINAANLSLVGIESVENDGSFFIKGNSKVKISIDKSPISEYAGEVSIEGWVILQDKAKLTFSSFKRDSDINISCGFELRKGTTELTFGEAGKPCPIIFDSSDVKSGRYKGIFNFIHNQVDGNGGSLVFINPADNFFDLLIKGDYININGAPATYKKDYLAYPFKQGGVESVVVALKQ
ncbi:MULTISPECIES: hypothetical protein [Lelliottia]|uniref:Uncharacterized protein n=1 Tax=Lelliottia aquatilis TaxID=2080838 RepID=A0ABX5A2S1_9ENTR|nr:MULTISPECIES: hypothetical protein [Lelliottia]POZ14102.1 hypothetical protein C3Z09_20235 [Lelliottia aquatilis]POZ24005.1 hypothetical protein C3712_07240 [Lelliottia aquatilis]POZ27593.1 hypothetical protein C3708_08415 [Lelliottia sp. 7254-16]POZ29863.1 hypothetical protein C3711_01625 [Lelliottia aquatilis]POZ35428.1 hypothetical protein C3710_01625 [Lelliottia aquatilis]